MIDEDWRGFSSAFAESVRPEDPRGRTGKRMLVVSVSAVLAVALGALVYGALGGPAFALPSEVGPIAPSPDATPYQAGGQSAGQVWKAIAGPDCAASSDGSTSFAVYGYSTGADADGTAGWSEADSGGYTGEACTGGYISMPVSGKADAYDATRYALWKYDFSSKFTVASCRVSSYVPADSSRAHVGGSPAYFYYYDDDYAFGTAPEKQQKALGGFLVDQVGRSKQGHWFNSPSFTVRTGRVSVKLVDAGTESADTAEGVHVAAAQLRLTCTST
ncbi:hypothetical protein ACFYXS_17315 [Streptomyces sp. NPDC002574]|uniref:hypothetical protein n=1 Tax=Streptomyces sp. NPDC002574 TaxID=3364652 RepID=UPI0036A3909F